MSTVAERYKKWKQKQTDVAENYRRWNAPKVANEIYDRTNAWLKNTGTFIGDHNSRYGGDNSLWRGDASDYYNNALKSTGEFDTEADAILDLMNRYGSYYDDDFKKSISDALSPASPNRNGYVSVITDAKKDYDYWSQWESEDEYKRWLANQPVDLSTYDIDAARADLEQKQATYDKYYADVDKWNTTVNDGKIRLAEIERKLGVSYGLTDKQRKELENEANVLRSTIAAGEEYIASIDLSTPKSTIDKLTKEINSAQAWRDREARKAETNRLYEEFVASPDYADIVKKHEDDSFYDGSLGELLKKTYGTLFNPQNMGNRIVAAKANAGYEFDNITSYKSAAKDTPNSVLPLFMDEKEQLVYNTYYYRGEYDKAEEYYKSIEGDLEERARSVANTNAAQFAKDKPFWSSAQSVGHSVFGTPTEAAVDLIKYGIDTVKDPTTAKLDRNDMADTVNITRQTVSEDMTPVGRFFYNTAMSGLDSLLSGLAFGNVGGVTLALSAGSSAYNEGIDRGMSSQQAMAYGIASGLFEGIFESGSLGNLEALKEISPKSLKEIAVNIAKSMGVNASEETFTEIANIAYDTLFNGEYSKYQEMLDSGMSKSEALGQFVRQVLEAGASGALMGLGFGGIGSATGWINNKINTTAIPLQDRSAYPYSMATVIQEYIDNINTDVLSYAKECRSDKNTTYKRIKISDVSEKQANDAHKLLNMDFTGYQNSVERSALNHIEKRHGEHGVADNSMKDLNDVSRIGYVLDNYDTVEITTDADGNETFSKQFRDKDNNPAPLLKYSKKINGTYYAVIACPDAKYKKLWLVSAYIEQKKDSTVTQEFDEKTPNGTPKASLASPYAANNSISQTEGVVNRENLSSIGGQVAEYARILKIGEQGVRDLNNVISSMGEGADVGNVVQAYNAVYQAGKQGKDISEARNPHLQMLSAEQKEVAYNAGFMDSMTKKKSSDGVLKKDADSVKIETTQSRRENNDGKQNKSGLLSRDPVSDREGYSEISSESKGTSGDIDSRRIHRESGEIRVLSEDSEGRSIKPDTLSKISQTAVVDVEGKPIPLYHATDKSFDKFAIGDIGFHFGNKTQADTRASAKSIANPRYISAYLNIKNPLRVNSDYMNWHANSVALNLWNEGLISDAEMKEVVSLWPQGKNYDSPAAVKLREILESKGYDGIAYPNGFEGDGTSYIAFHDEQIVRVKSDTNVHQAKETAIEPENDHSDPDVQYSKGNNAEWDAERIKDGKAEKAKPISEIIEQIRHDFGINITKGHVRGKNTLGQYSKRNHGIRTKIANDLPTVSHELGHALDQRYQLTDKSRLTKEMRAELESALGGLKDSYKQNLWVSEGLAEYIRRFLQNKDEAARAYPEFTKYFINSLSKADQILMDTFADEINAYYALDGDTATSSIRLREEGLPDARTPLEKAREMGDDIYQAWVDANHGIKLFDEATGASTHKLASNAAYSDAIAGQIITGELTDANGQYVAPGLKAALEGVDIGNKKVYREFGEYLVVRHGPERLREGMMIFADARKNTASFMAKRVAELEAAHPEFKEAADRLYEFQKQFLKTWAVDTGLIPAEIAEAWAKRWAYYVPLNRAVGKAGMIGAKRGYANQNSTVKKAIGSGLDIVHPVDNIINNIVKMVNAGVRNNVMLAITAQADKLGADATFLEKVPTPMKKKTADLTGVKAKLHDAFGAAGIGELLAEVEGESEPEYSYHKTFSEQIDDVVSGTHNPVYDLYVGNTPSVLINLGFDNKPLLMRNSKIKETLDKHSEMSIELIKQIPDAVADPVMILKSKTNPNDSVVVITDILTAKGHMIIPVWVSQDGTYLDVEIGKSVKMDTNFVATAYGRNVKGLIEYAFNNNQVLFYAEDKKRVSSLLATHGLQLPARLSTANSTISISHKNENVNKNFSTNSSGSKSGAWSQVDEIIESAIDDVLIQYGQGKAHGDVVTVLRNGKEEFWKINDALLLESLTNLSQKKVSGILEAYSVVSRFMTSNITGNNIIWSIFSNFPRDMMTFFTYSKNKNPLKAFASMGEAYLNKITDGVADTAHKAYIYEYYGLGGGQTSAYTADVDLAKRARKKLKNSSKLQSAAYYANPLNTLSFISETVESGPRIATYIMMREQGMSPQDAFYESQDITVNFKRGGRMSREMNRVVPFFNASVQGLDKFARWITCTDVPKAQRSKAIIGRATMYIAVSAALGALFYALNNSDDEDEEDYRLLSNYTKNSYWNIPLGDGKYFAIPKPREIAVLSTFVETTCEYFGGNDYAYDGFGEYVADNFLPPFLSDLVTNGFDGAIGSLGMIGVGHELGANKDFLGRPIESTSLQGYESRDRYTRRTSKIAYWLGQAAAELGLDWSPVQIDYFFGQTLGGYWKVQKALFPVGSENVDWTLGVQNTYIKDNQYSNDIVNWLYDEANASKQAKKSNPDDMDIAIEAKLDGNMQEFYSRYYALTKGQKEDSASREAHKTVLNMIIEYRKATDNGDRSAAEKLVHEIVSACKDTSLLPSVMQSTVKDSEKNEYKLTDIQYVEYQTTYDALYWNYVEDNLDVNASDAEKRAVLKQAHSIAKERATEKTLKSAGAGSSGFFEKYSGVDDKDIITFKAKMDLADDEDGSVNQKELIAIIEAMVELGLSKEDAYTLFHTEYESDKNNPWRRYAP